MKFVHHSNDYIFHTGMGREGMRGFSPSAEPDMIYISIRTFWLCCAELTVGGQCERRETGLGAITVNQVGVVWARTRLLIMRVV